MAYLAPGALHPDGLSVPTPLVVAFASNEFCSVGPCATWGDVFEVWAFPPIQVFRPPTYLELEGFLTLDRLAFLRLSTPQTEQRTVSWRVSNPDGV